MTLRNRLRRALLLAHGIQLDALIITARWIERLAQEEKPIDLRMPGLVIQTGMNGRMTEDEPS